MTGSYLLEQDALGLAVENMYGYQYVNARQWCKRIVW